MKTFDELLDEALEPWWPLQWKDSKKGLKALTPSHPFVTGIADLPDNPLINFKLLILEMAAPRS